VKTNWKIDQAVNRIRLPDVVGKGYAAFWRFKGRYRVVKGSRASKKSKTTALNLITNMMKYPFDANGKPTGLLPNLLVVRKTYRTLKDSCYTELKWAVHRLGVDEHWDFKLNPLEAVYKPTGQKIYFRGLDDPLKVTSITVDVGVLCWAWLEEAYEVMNEDDFNILDESIRGECPEGLYKQWTITFNPWNERHWLKRRFFDAAPDPDILAITTNYLCNEWLDAADIKVFETMRRNNPRRYAVAGLGGWGIVDGLVYENWKEEAFDPMSAEFRAKHPNLVSAFGMDFGYTNDPSTLFCALLDQDAKQLFVFDEMYQTGMSNRAIADKVAEMGYTKEHITADSAEPKSIAELKTLGLRVKAAQKGKDSVQNGIQWIQDLEIIIHPRCVNFLTEISNYTWDKDKFGTKLNVPIDDFNHLMDAMRYALEKYIAKKKWIA
jgi:phage terminase large subunit